mgnify:CR=1 FL=1
MGKSVIATKISLVLGLILALIFGSAPVGAFAAVVRTTYIVQVQDGFANEVRGSIAKLGEYPHDELTEVMDGFVVDLTDVEAEALRTAPYVKQVVADAPMSLMDTQSPVPSWGLDRIDQNATAGDGAYNFPASAGQGVRIYIADTGVMASNPDFAGRMLPGVDMYGQNLENADCQGHGTHVAGTAAGTKYGVAKKAWIVPIRVLSCSGSGSWSYLISAMDWIIANNPAGTPAVMSASIGGASYPLANAAMEKLYAAGITPIIAAGNSNIDACGTSPAGAPNAITVGASESNDARASYSNWGECVDVFAPGSGIVSDSNLDPTIGVAKSGTSMATPHVSGLAALYLSTHPTASPAEVTAAIKAGGLVGAVANANSTLGNILINNTFTRASVPVAPAPVYPPTGVTASAITSTSATISWTAPAVDPAVASTAPDSYNVEYKLATDTVWQSQVTTATSVTLNNLTLLGAYVVRVTSIAGSQTSVPTAELQFSTLGTAPDAPTNLAAVTIYGNQIDLSWSRPNTNGANITGYNVEWLTNGIWNKNMVIGSSATTVTASVKNLTPLTSYSFRITAYNTFGTSLPSNVLTVSTSAATPVTPSAIVMSNITGTTATATWKPSPQIDTATPITYVVRIYSRQISNFGAVLGTYTATTNSYVVTGLKRTTSYSLSVTALSGTASSPTSGTVVFTTTSAKPGAPTSTKAVKTASGFTLSWMSPADDGGSAVTSYQLEVQAVDGSWSTLATLGSTVYSYNVPFPARATAVNYRVAATNALGLGAYAAITVSTPADLPGAPQNLTLTRTTGSSTLNWSAPTENGGAAILGYVVWRSVDNGTNWVAYNSAVTATTFVVGVPAKGIKYVYAVSARNESGVGTKSNTVTDETVATAPSAVRSVSFGYTPANKLQINWGIPVDGGGSPITAYRLERQAADGTWSVLNESNVLNFQIDRDLPGVLVAVRVTAINAVGSSAALSASWRTPYLQASAPQNFTAVDNGSTVVTTWAAPADLGGSTVSYYYVQMSKDGGVTWANLTGVTGAGLGATVARPTKGTTWNYRVVALTAFGISLPSNTVAISPAKTNPNAPTNRSLSFVADGSLTYAWYLPADNGGSPITSVIVEKSTDNISWTAIDGVAANATSVNVPRELPGVRLYFRVKVATEIGASNYSPVASILTPYLKASAPQNFTATDNGSTVAVSWNAPASLGGSVVSQYAVQVSRDGGSTWGAIGYFGSTAVSGLVSRPTKGATWSYRIVARTGFGDSEASTAVVIASALTAPSAPRLASMVLNADATITVKWTAPTDNGGSALTGYVVERSADNVNWTVLSTQTELVITTPAGGPGARTFIRVKATNAVGTSVQSSAYSVMVPYQVTSEPTSLVAASPAAGRVQLTWLAPATLGGSNVSQYQIQSSNNNGATWLTLGYSSTLTAVLNAPAKGITMSYRVLARNAAGYSAPSNVATYTTPNTVASSVRLTAITANGAGNFNVTFVAPYDLGGYTSYGYRIEVYVGGVWTAVATGTGAATNVVAIRTPSNTATYTYRVIATNPSGDSAPASFNYRG